MGEDQVRAQMRPPEVTDRPQRPTQCVNKSVDCFQKIQKGSKTPRIATKLGMRLSQTSGGNMGAKNSEPFSIENTLRRAKVTLRKSALPRAKILTKHLEIS